MRIYFIGLEKILALSRFERIPVAMKIPKRTLYHLSQPAPTKDCLLQSKIVKNLELWSFQGQCANSPFTNTDLHVEPQILGWLIVFIK